MANTTTALNYQEASKTIREIQENLNNIHKFSGIFVGAAETALEKSTEQKWMRDIVDIGIGIQKKCLDASAVADDSVVGLRKFDEELREFADSGISADI